MARPAPITVCVRRRAAPARRMTVARGQRIDLQRRGQVVEQPADLGGGHVAVQRELRGRGLQLALGVATGQTDLAGDVGQREGGEAVEHEQLALARGQLGQGLEGAAGLGVERLVAVPDARGVATAGPTEGERDGRRRRGRRGARPCASGAR